MRQPDVRARSPEVLDHYEATYDPLADTLDGYWTTGTQGTFQASHELTGELVAPLNFVQVSSQTGSTPGTNLTDGDLSTYWSSANNQTVGEVLRLALGTPRALRGIRILTWDNGNPVSFPVRATVTAFDSGGGVLAQVDVPVSAVGLWRALDVRVDAPVAEIELRITELENPGASRVGINEVEVFVAP